MQEHKNFGYDSSKKGFDEDDKTYQERTSDTKKEVKESWNQDVDPQENQKVLAGVLAIVLGGFGVHKFILGYNEEGVTQIIITVATCGLGSIIGVIEGIIYLTKSDEDFYQTYQVGKRGWF